MNRPNLPPLRVAVAQFNDPEVLEPPRDHVKRDIQNRIGCSNRLHSDLSFYSLASSSSQFNSSSNGLMLPSSHLLSSRHIDNAGYSSIPPSNNYSKRRSCSDMNQTSGNRHDYMDIKSNQRHEPGARSERSNPPEINSWQQSSSKFSESYRTTQKANLTSTANHKLKSEEILIQPTVNHIRILLMKIPSSGKIGLVGLYRKANKLKEIPNYFQDQKLDLQKQHQGLATFAPCMATFYRRNDLTRHERAHTGLRPYRCECGQDFTRTDLLARHKHSGNCTYQINA
ncbi:hypothetical protein PCASD_14103 [Puccinia coronata f. sp. avenae]|uniref:C2H2-type domain-containing protein n=1 Tax=Puccinia coronata f. sp. avenae TaxID=200324 RepID=A0A2N5U767_9BASI|nr:hypothetical protein PCASD_14103 [Puccinia coronata f. sp. avenae]